MTAEAPAPMLATLVDDVVGGEEWIYERKLDGIRLIVVREGSTTRLLTRNGHDRASTYPELATALVGLDATSFVADGEVVAFDGDVTSFSRLQQRSGLTSLSQREVESIAVFLYLFDLVEHDGDDLRDLPLRERKARLRDVIDFGDPLRFCPHRNGRDRDRDREHARSLLDEACGSGWEGLIAKRADGPYRSGRSRDWLKLKCVARQELVVGGYTEPSGSRTGFGALLVGYHDQPQNGRASDAAGADDAQLRFAGRVGTGYDRATLEALSDRLRRQQRRSSPFVDAPGGTGVHWVTPDIVCEVGFTEWTTAGRLRHPRFLGVREDKAPTEVVRETPETAP